MAKRLGRLGLFAIQRVELYRKLEAQVLRGAVHLFCVGIGAGHRLFAVHLLARLQRRNRHRHVKVVVQAHVHGLDVVARQQVAKVRVHVGNAVQLGDTVCLGLVDVGDGDHLGAIDLGIVVEVTLADLPYPDDTNSYFVHFGILLTFVDDRGSGGLLIVDTAFSCHRGLREHREFGIMGTIGLL